jgi:hypothetical protein
MSADTLDIERGVEVEGVGSLTWAASYTSVPLLSEDPDVFGEATVHYAYPNGGSGEHNFVLKLKLGEPFRESGGESFHIWQDPLTGEYELEHNADHIDGEELKTLPWWLIDFLKDLQVQTRAEDVYCFYDDDREDSNLLEMDIDVSYARNLVKDRDTFLQSTAKQISQYSRFEQTMQELEAAYRAQDAAECYRALENIPYGAYIEIDGAAFRLVRATKDEKAMLERSLADQRELALVKSWHAEEIVEGQSSSIDLDDFFPAIRRVFENTEHMGVFSHTHPSHRLHPLPSWGDIVHWRMLMANYPNIENRVVFMSGDEAKAFRFIGFDGHLFGDQTVRFGFSEQIRDMESWK